MLQPHSALEIKQKNPGVYIKLLYGTFQGQR